MSMKRLLRGYKAKHGPITGAPTLLQVLERLNFEIPKFCYHEKLNVAGNCRMCLVEVEKAPKPIAACAAPFSEMAEVYVSSPLAQKAREGVLEFMLLNHPLDCPICEQASECDLQEHTWAYGADRARNYTYPRRPVVDKDFGPVIKSNMTRCIHCTRCVRFTEKYTGQLRIGTMNRGHFTEIGSHYKPKLLTELSGNLVDICPVGALREPPQAPPAPPAGEEAARA